jgi:deoxycytidylate deaminase
VASLPQKIDRTEVSPKLTELDITSRETRELIFALCGPIGSPLHSVADLLKSSMERIYGYECHIIRLSDIIEKRAEFSAVGLTPYERKIRLIEKGNKLRETFGTGVLAEYAIHDISVRRALKKGPEQSVPYQPLKICYIIDSIKNENEIEAFRDVYRDLFFIIGVFSPLEARQKVLLREIKEVEVATLINLDSGEEVEHGQSVRKSFPQSDFFLRVDSGSDTEIRPKLERYLDLIFGTAVVTPSFEESAMYQAWSAAGNSACLSRQVGACLTDSNGEILSIGWNDVPKSNGGLYLFDSMEILGQKDHRCKNIEGGKCFNDENKTAIVKEIADTLIKAGILSEDKRKDAIEKIGDSKIKDLIEFSRAIHAEMHAIITGSQKTGHRVKGGKLFCTTYPCHSCARHIIAAGIKDVFFIEPYRKSLAIKLHWDSITESEEQTDKVRIRLFDGVAPSKYLRFFKILDDRKSEEVKKIRSSKKEARPIARISLESLPALESIVVRNLIAKNAIRNEENDAT